MAPCMHTPGIIDLFTKRTQELMLHGVYSMLDRTRNTRSTFYVLPTGKPLNKTNPVLSVRSPYKYSIAD